MAQPEKPHAAASPAPPDEMRTFPSRQAPINPGAHGVVKCSGTLQQVRSFIRPAKIDNRATA
eukprot:scaffold3045_cov134-Pinguiococcus_pyrenoidosus.AAC.1